MPAFLKSHLTGSLPYLPNVALKLTLKSNVTLYTHRHLSQMKGKK